MPTAGVVSNTAVAGGSALLAGQVLTLVSPVFAHYGLALSENQENALIALVTLAVGWVAHSGLLSKAPSTTPPEPVAPAVPSQPQSGASA